MSTTPRQQRFIEEAAATDTGAEAARLAGYSPRRAKETASELMARPSIRQAVEARRSDVLREARYDAVSSVLRLVDEQEHAERSRDRIRAAELLLKLDGHFRDGPTQQHLHLSGISVGDLRQMRDRLLAD